MVEPPGEGVNLRKSAAFCENLRLGLGLSPWVRPLKRPLTLIILKQRPNIGPTLGGCFPASNDLATVEFEFTA